MLALVLETCLLVALKSFGIELLMVSAAPLEITRGSALSIFLMISPLNAWGADRKTVLRDPMAQLTAWS